jgi:hypothetical protein
MRTMLEKREVRTPRLAFLILAVVAAGCAAQANDGSAPVESEFEDTVSQIQSEFEKHGVHVPITATIQFGNPSLDSGNDRSIADCNQGSLGKVINVSRSYWDAASDLDRLYTLAHEIGHCVLGRKHITAWVTVNGKLIPSSIMFPYAQTASKYDSFARDYYFAELVRGVKSL